jgi:hypothetical protein
MRVSEKSLELNVGAEMLWRIRETPGRNKAYLRGLTQKEEAAAGVDFFVELDADTRLFAFQFKAPRGAVEGEPYRYTLASKQHDLLYELAQSAPGSVFYVFPYYVTPAKLQQNVPDLLQDTWLLNIAPIPTREVFGGQATKTVRCKAGQAEINPGYSLQTFSNLAHELHGISPPDFAKWYSHLRPVGPRLAKQRNPWLVRGLHIVIVPGVRPGGPGGQARRLPTDWKS